MNTTRTPIRRRVQRIVMLVAILALVAATMISVFTVRSIQKDSGEALTEQLEVNLLNTIADKAQLADSKFGKFEESINDYASVIHDMYVDKERFANSEVLPPNAENKGVFTMQRYLRDETVTIEDVQDEAAIFGNLESLWRPAVEQNKDVITTIYLGTERGLHVAFDPASDLGVEEGSEESHFDYTGSDWYVRAKEEGKSGFTGIYQDSYGRGMMVSCYAPFYDANDQFCGVVCMDMLISDIYQQIVSMDLGEGGNVFLIDSNGSTVDPKDNEKIIQIEDAVSSISVVEAMKYKERGFRLTAEDVYYAYAPVESTGWELCIGIPRDTVLESVDVMNLKIWNSYWMYLILLLVLSAIVAVVSHTFAGSLTKPLIELGKDAMTISQGNLDYRASVRSNDEIGDLAERFNDMAQSLKHYIADLTQVTAEKERIGAELNVATQIQADMLPRIFPAFPEREDFDIYATMTPAKEVGGDFYDFFLVDDDHIAMVMADVSGKGVPAALFMVIAKTLIKTRTQMGGGPAQILCDVNEQLCEGNEAGLFVTVWLGIVDLKTGKGLAANAGHEHPAIRRGKGEFEMVKYRHSPAVAAMEGIPYKEHEFELAPGDALFVYTDGVPEATDANEELFGEERTLLALNKDPNAKPEVILAGVKESIDEFVGDATQFDDITMLCFEFFGRDSEA